jgi:hypothetical protein
MKSAPEDYLPYIVIDDPKVPLVSAAALSANFPPVFPNAAIDIAEPGEDDYRWRYWLTDGGATDNRGVISLLYALEGAINKLSIRPKEDRNKLKLPPIHIVVVDASATEYFYNQDRGIKTTLGAAERFASQLMIEKIAEIAQLYHEINPKNNAKIYLHKLSMPLSFRCAGGIGTHWMLPNTVTLRKPTKYKNKNDLKLEKSDNKTTGYMTFIKSFFSIIPHFLNLSESGVMIEGHEAIEILEILHEVTQYEETQLENYTQRQENIVQNFVCDDPSILSHKKSWCCFTKTINDEKLETYIDAICENKKCEEFNCSDVLIEF